MSTLQGLVLAGLQGLTEFLPVSSSGHLVLAPHFLRWPEPGLGFTVALHLGTLVAVLVFFWREIGAVFATAVHRSAECRVRRGEALPRPQQGDPPGRPYNTKLAGIGPSTLWMIIVGTVPAGVMGLAFHDKFERLFGMPLGVAGFLVLTAALLVVSERVATSRRSTAEMRWWQALLIGFAQGCAIAPGLSRSGATIAAGLLLGFERTQATKFAFLLSIPAILGAGLWELPKAEGFSAAWLLAMAVAAIFGYLAIKWVLAAVQKARLRYFGLYCLLVGAGTVACHLVR